MFGTKKKTFGAKINGGKNGASVVDVFTFLSLDFLNRISNQINDSFDAFGSVSDPFPNLLSYPPPLSLPLKKQTNKKGYRFDWLVYLSLQRNNLNRVYFGGKFSCYLEGEGWTLNRLRFITVSAVGLGSLPWVLFVWGLLVGLPIFLMTLEKEMGPRDL